MAAAPETDSEQVSYAWGSAPLESQKRPSLQVPEASRPSGDGRTEQGADVQSKRWDPSAGLTSRAWGSSLPCRADGGPHACPRTRTLQPSLPLCSSHSKRLWSTRDSAFPSSSKSFSESQFRERKPHSFSPRTRKSTISQQLLRPPLPTCPHSGLCVRSSGEVSNHVTGLKSEGSPCPTNP